ncbi:MAG: phosphatase PAP2 family protein [Thermoplasmata archaeon]|nr:phosphatase PAP2 family protein [Thermoplasmata archaeon]
MWTGIDLLFLLQDIRVEMPDFISQIYLWISSVELQYFIPVLIMAFLLWCYGHKEAELVMLNFGFSNMVGYLTKYIVQQPRPWVLDPTLDPDPAAKSEAHGYSLPSGHTTSAVSTFGTLAWIFRHHFISVIGITICILVPFSRMFFGVHTPLDIIVAIIVVLVVSFVNFKILEISYQSPRNRVYVLVGYAVTALIMSLVCDYFAGKMFSNKMCGFCIAVPICILVKERYLNYEMPAIPLKEHFKRALPGLIISFAIMEMIYRMMTSNGSTIGLTVVIVFIILVYPFILKKWDERNAAKTESNQ